MNSEHLSGAGGRLTPFSVVITAMAVAFAMVVTMSKQLSYDEPWYQSSVEAIEKQGLTREWIRDLPGPAGPTYAVTHYVLRGLTGGTAVGIRLATLVMLSTSIVLLYVVGRRVAPGDARQWAVLLAVPPTVLSAGGMALTEVPALMFQCSALCLLWTASGVKNPAGYFGMMGLSGLCFSAAILGRQPLLATLPIYAAFGVRPGDAGWRREVCGSGLAVLCALAPAAVVFAIWGGLVPPLTADVGKGFRLDHAITAFGYGGLFHLLIDPSILRVRSLPSLGAAVSVAAVGGLVSGVRMAPLRSSFEKILPPVVMEAYAFAFTMVVMSLGVLYAMALVRKIRNLKTEWVEGLAAAAILILCLSAGAITHLTSSRYVVNTVPFMMLASLTRPSSLTLRGALSLLGVVGGLLSLHGYLSR